MLKPTLTWNRTQTLYIWLRFPAKMSNAIYQFLQHDAKVIYSIYLHKDTIIIYTLIQIIHQVGISVWVYSQFHSFIPDCFYSASSSPQLLRGAPDYSINSVAVNTPKRYRQLWVKDLPKVPTWRLEWDSNQRPSRRKVMNLSLSHHAPLTWCVCVCVWSSIIIRPFFSENDILSLYFTMFNHANNNSKIIKISLVEPQTCQFLKCTIKRIMKWRKSQSYKVLI